METQVIQTACHVFFSFAKERKWVSSSGCAGVSHERKRVLNQWWESLLMGLQAVRHLNVYCHICERTEEENKRLIAASSTVVSEHTHTRMDGPVI